MIHWITQWKCSDDLYRVSDFFLWLTIRQSNECDQHTCNSDATSATATDRKNSAVVCDDDAAQRREHFTVTQADMELAWLDGGIQWLVMHTHQLAHPLCQCRCLQPSSRSALGCNWWHASWSTSLRAFLQSYKAVYCQVWKRLQWMYIF